MALFNNSARLKNSGDRREPCRDPLLPGMSAVAPTPRSTLDHAMCEVRWVDRANALPRVSHLYGFSPVCVRICLVRVPDRANVL